MDLRVLLTLCVILVAVVAAKSPTVRLSKGTSLVGKQTTFRGVKVNLFLGVPYAKPPIDDLRFRKPVRFPKWEGKRLATTMSDSCYQSRIGGTPVGNEDCLYLDITVPKLKPKPGRRRRPKAVVIYFHGGLFLYGSKTWYFGAPLAVHGDVIVVTVNYRVGPLGFLSEGPGTGNFGLWDQHMAIKWVKKNIGKFGGNPNRITIFGESAGAMSVASHAMSRHSDGLFKRTIQMSGALYTFWSWYLSVNERNTQAEAMKTSYNCSESSSLYECLRHFSPFEIVAGTVSSGAYTAFHPVPDNDFFPSDISEETYKLSKRFDLLSGFAGQEYLIVMNSIFTKDGPFYTNGIPLEFASGLLLRQCTSANPSSVEACVAYLLDKYGLATITDNKERALQLTDLLGEVGFMAPAVKQLDKHSPSRRKRTYGYYLNEKYNEPKSLGYANLPDWIRKSAIHYDIIPFVFGGYYIQQEYEHIFNAYTEGANLTLDDRVNSGYYNGTSSNFKELNDIIMTSFTNFIKSGNPNKPNSLPEGTPRWPQYNTGSNKLMEFSSNYSTNAAPVSTPHKDRLDGVSDVIFGAAKEQTLNDN